MLPHTLDNSFVFGYGAGVFNPLDKSPENALYCRYERCTREPGSFRAECVQTALLIGEHAKKLGRTPYVLLSGGMDSEVAVLAFIEAGVPFKAITFRFKNLLNAHEIVHVERFKKLGFAHEYFDIDILSWYKTPEAAKLFDESQCASFTMVPHMKLMSHVHELGGLPVLGNGDVYLEQDAGRWKYVELEYMLAWYRHAIKNRILGAIGFFQFTPEITLAMLREPKIQAIGENRDPYATKIYETSRFIKYAIYRKFWPELVNRQKYGGQERVREQFKARSLELLGSRDPYNDKVWCEYSDFRAMLEPDEAAYRLSRAARADQMEARTPTES